MARITHPPTTLTAQPSETSSDKRRSGTCGEKDPKTCALPPASIERELNEKLGPLLSQDELVEETVGKFCELWSTYKHEGGVRSVVDDWLEQAEQSERRDMLAAAIASITPKGKAILYVKRLEQSAWALHRWTLVAVFGTATLSSHRLLDSLCSLARMPGVTFQLAFQELSKAREARMTDKKRGKGVPADRQWTPFDGHVAMSQLQTAGYQLPAHANSALQRQRAQGRYRDTEREAAREKEKEKKKKKKNLMQDSVLGHKQPNLEPEAETGVTEPETETGRGDAVGCDDTTESDNIILHLRRTTTTATRPTINTTPASAPPPPPSSPPSWPPAPPTPESAPPAPAPFLHDSAPDFDFFDISAPMLDSTFMSDPKRARLSEPGPPVPAHTKRRRLLGGTRDAQTMTRCRDLDTERNALQATFDLLFGDDAHASGDTRSAAFTRDGILWLVFAVDVAADNSTAAASPPPPRQNSWAAASHEKASGKAHVCISPNITLQSVLPVLRNLLAQKELSCADDDIVEKHAGTAVSFAGAAQWAVSQSMGWPWRQHASTELVWERLLLSCLPRDNGEDAAVDMPDRDEVLQLICSAVEDRYQDSNSTAAQLDIPQHIQGVTAKVSALGGALTSTARVMDDCYDEIMSIRDLLKSDHDRLEACHSNLAKHREKLEFHIKETTDNPELAPLLEGIIAHHRAEIAKLEGQSKGAPLRRDLSLELADDILELQQTRKQYHQELVGQIEQAQPEVKALAKALEDVLTLTKALPTSNAA